MGVILVVVAAIRIRAAAAATAGPATDAHQLLNHEKLFKAKHGGYALLVIGAVLLVAGVVMLSVTLTLAAGVPLGELIPMAVQRCTP